jgi:predicted signal transduction protein with EAL and GGDEF domain
MSSDSLIQALPDLVTFVHRNGTITRHVGGRAVVAGLAGADLTGKRLDDLWSEDAAQLLGQMIRKALSTREQVDGRFVDGMRRYEARIEPKGPERALCVIRAMGGPSAACTTAEVEDRAPRVDRRGFLGRFNQSVAEASLREQPLAVCMILLQGLEEIGRIIDFSISERVATAALLRVQGLEPPGAAMPPWYMGQLGDDLLAVVIEGSQDRELLRRLGLALCDSLAQSITVGDASFQLSPRGGIALLGEDARHPQALLEHARAAMNEARRSASAAVCFYSNTLRLRPLSRLDFERELREALDGDQLALRYAARHDVATGRLVAVQAYLRWPHPLRGEVRPAEFLPIAESTGLSTPLSRWAIRRLRTDLSGLRARLGPDLRVSFGALRHHLASDTLAEDVGELLASGDLAPGSLELRVAERTVAGLEMADRTLGRLAELGALLVIDEFGRGFTSFARLVHLPFHALQLDRSFVKAVDEDPAALRICRAAAALARQFDMVPIASGIDNGRDLDHVREAGFEQGLGDLYGQTLLESDSPAPGQATA